MLTLRLARLAVSFVVVAERLLTSAATERDWRRSVVVATAATASCSARLGSGLLAAMERRERLTELLRRKRRSLHRGQGLQIQLNSIQQTFIGFFDDQHSG
jgi:hypothetical protein